MADYDFDNSDCDVDDDECEDDFDYYYINEYDDLQDDDAAVDNIIIEDSGYDVWSFSGLKYIYEELYLYQFKPEYISENPHFNQYQTVSYQDLIDLSDMTVKLVGAWKKRYNDLSPLYPMIERKSFSNNGFSNLFELFEEDQELLLAWSVQELLRRLGGYEEFLHLATKIVEVNKFVNTTISRFLGSCFPSIPYPALCIIHTHLIKQGGLKNLDSLTENHDEEERHMVKLYAAIAKIYVDLKVLMFDARAKVEIGDITLRIHKMEERLLEFSSYRQSSFSQMVEQEDTKTNTLLALKGH